MMKKGLSVLLFSAWVIGTSPAISATFTVEVPTTSGLITRQITAFDESGLTAWEAYNYTGDRYDGQVDVQPGTNVYFSQITSGMGLFMVNTSGPFLTGLVSYYVTLEGGLLVRDDVLEVDFDPLNTFFNPNGTTTFLSYEGFVSDGNCGLRMICRTDGIVLGLTPSDPDNQVITWGYNPDFPPQNIPRIHFWSNDPSENFSVALGSEFDPSTGQIVMRLNSPHPESIPEGHSLMALLGFVFSSLIINFSQKSGNRD